MRKAIAVLLALLLIPAMPTAEAESNLLEVGIIDTIDGRFIHTSFSSSSTMITLTTTGNLSEHFWGSGELITQWSIELNTTANSATPDATGLQIAVAHTGGVYIVNTELKIVTTEYNTSNSVDAVAWDSEGDLWFGFYGGERRAKEFDSLEETGETTEAHNTAMTAMTIISQDRIVTGGRDNLVKIFTQEGVFRTVSQISHLILPRLSTTVMATSLLDVPMETCSVTTSQIGPKRKHQSPVDKVSFRSISQTMGISW